MNKARITYRFDQSRNDGSREQGKPVKEDQVIPLFEEEFHVVEEQITAAEPLNTFTTDFGSWNSVFETESDRVERVIRESAFDGEKSIPTRPLESKQYQEPQIDPEVWSSWTNTEQRIEMELGPRIVKSSTTPWFRIATSVAAAVITGIAFGFFVLSMFTNNDVSTGNLPENTLTKQSAQTSHTESKDTETVQAHADSAKASQSTAGTGGNVNATPLRIAAKSYTFLQNGVFSTLQSAQSAQSELKKKGFASALQQGDKTIVYVAFASSRDEALSISQPLKDQKLEVYIKNMDIPAVASIRWNGSKPELLGSYIAQGDKLIQMLSGLTIVHLAEKNHTPLDDSTIQGIRSAHQTLTTLAGTLNESADKEVNPLIEQMDTALSSAVQSMEEYKKNPSAAMLWQTQSSMMQYILSQKDLLSEISIS